jgi:hypothetical protein
MSPTATEDAMASGAQQTGELAAAIEAVARALTAIADAAKYYADLNRETQQSMHASMVALFEKSRAADREENEP